MKDRKKLLLLNKISMNSFNCKFNQLNNEHYENIVLENYEELEYLINDYPF
mgnify:CR=1 FL=1